MSLGPKTSENISDQVPTFELMYFPDKGYALRRIFV